MNVGFWIHFITHRAPSLLKRMIMRIVAFLFWSLLLFPPNGWAEVWDFTCTEAVSLLKAAQDLVVQKHDELQEAKFSLRHAPTEFDGCRKSRRGYQGGKIHCVKHQSKRGNQLRDILVAQRSLDVSLQNFERQVQGVLRACPNSSP